MHEPALDPRISPSQIPRSALPGPQITPPPRNADACLNFNLPDGRLVLFSAPLGLAESDVPFLVSVIQAHATAVARRGR
jgi:hypothetical protein